MLKVKLKDNIRIEGFDDLSTNVKRLNAWADSGIYSDNLLYIGKTSKIPINISKELFDCGYDDLDGYSTSLDESIKSACNHEYCLIYKTK